jgi:hypothetical protein
MATKRAKELEAILKKSGAELFRELVRQYPEADVEDYRKVGVWKDEQMRLDVRLFIAHRSEAGAPEAVPLSEVPVPQVKDVPVASMPVLGALSRPGVLPQANLTVRPALSVATPATAMGVATELREISMFVTKTKLDPMKSKAALSPLTPSRRRYVIQNFKNTASGEDGVAELLEYIKRCESSGAFAEADKTAASAPTMTASVASPAAPLAPASGQATTRPQQQVLSMGVTGVKRPLSLPPALDPSKRPRLGVANFPVRPTVLGARQPTSTPRTGVVLPGAVSPRIGVLPSLARPGAAGVRLPR